MAATAQDLDVLIVGAGISGIGAAVHLQQQCPGKTWATAQSSTNCSRVSQRLRSTNSRCTTANTPPNPCSASQENEKNKSAKERGAAGLCVAAVLGLGVCEIIEMPLAALLTVWSTWAESPP
jgi:succinate dehydrogenase/fumarate reductase flavoprotein subunit